MNGKATLVIDQQGRSGEPVSTVHIDDDPLAVATSERSVRVINRVTATGTTVLGPDADFYDSTGGLHQGQVHAGGGDDLLFGGTGADGLFGGNGADVIWGGGGDDFIDGGDGPDTLDGGAGFDTLSFVTSSIVVEVNLETGTAVSAGRDLVRNFERVVGSALADRIMGGAGADTLEGRDGSDILDGAGGADILIGGADADTLTGGTGKDRFVFAAGDGADIVTDFQIGRDRLVIHGFSTWQELRQVGTDTLVVLSDGDSLLLRGVSAANLGAASFEFHAGSPSIPADPAAPSMAHDEMIDVIIYEGEVRTGPEYGYVLRADQSWYDTGGGFHTPSMYNAGTVTVTGEYGASALAVGGGDAGNYGRSWMVNLATGTIRVAATGSEAHAGILQTYQLAINVFNAGALEVVSASHATALTIYSIYDSVDVVNTGMIDVEARYAVGVDLMNRVSFWNSGTITVNGAVTARGVRADNWVESFVNTGTITVSPASMFSVGLEVGSGRGLSVIYNDGIIEATTALLGSGSTPENPYVFGSDRIYNTGELRGAVDLDHSRDELYNTGRITGVITLGDGDDLYDGRGGVQLGGVHGEDGADTLLGGQGGDSLFGGDGDDLLAGGEGADTLTGGAGLDVFHFTAGGGRDVILDFSAAAGEVIRISGYSAYQSLTQVGADVLVVLSSTDSLLLRGLTLDAVTGAHFQFNAAPIGDAAPAPPRPGQPAQPPSTMMGDARNAPIVGEAGADTLAGTAQADVLHGLAGDDRITGGLGDDEMFGGLGADTFVYAFGDGNDVVYDFNLTEGDIIRLDGIPLVTTGGSDGYTIQQIVGDTIITINGGGTITFTNATLGDVTAAIQLGSPPGYRVLEGGSGVDSLDGSEVADLLRGNGGQDRLRGFAGDDLIEGGADSDTVEGGQGDDLLTGGAGADVFIIRPGDGSDTITDFNAAEGDILRLEGFTTFSSHFWSLADIIIAAGNQMITLTGVDNLAEVAGSIRLGPSEPTAPSILGTAIGERIIGTTQGERISGGSGGDIIIGGGGSDIIDGGDGDDTFSGDAGLDEITGGRGADTFLFRPGSHNDIITDFNAAEGDELRLEGYRSFSIWEENGNVFISVMQDFTGEYGTITLMNVTRAVAIAGIVLVSDEGPFPDIERDLYGGAGNDTLIGDSRNETILGGDGNDRIEGRGGRDLVEGGTGNDTVNGGDGDDLINGGTGTDTMIGGAGRDWFAFYAGDGADTISDFDVDQDVIDVAFEPIAAITAAGPNCVITLSSGDTLTLTGVQAHQIGASNFVRTLSTPPLVPVPSSAPQTGGSGADIMDGSALSDILNGEGGDDVLSGMGGDDSLSGGSGHDRLNGGAGDDTLTGGLGDDFIDGGSGHDVVIVSGVASSYRLLLDGDNFILKGPDGGDYLTGVENIRFSDGRVLELNRMYGPDVDTRAWVDGRIPEALLSGGAWSGERPLVLPGPAGDDFVMARDGGRPEVLPGAEDVFVVGAKDFDRPEVLPGVDDWTPAGTKGFDQPEVLPGSAGPTLLPFDRVALFDRWSDQMLTVDDLGLFVDHYARGGGWGPDGWSF